jgi:hypothetical protein
MLNALVVFWTVAAESAAWTVKLNWPEAVGVPLIDPPVERLKPFGSCPAVTLQIYGEVPPDALNDVDG